MTPSSCSPRWLTGRAGHRGRGMGGRRRGRRRQRPGAGRAAGRVELALDLPHQSAHHPRHLGGRRGDLAAARQHARQHPCRRARQSAARLAHRRCGNRPGAGRGGAGVHGADRGTGMAAVAYLAGTGRRARSGSRVRGPHPPSRRPPGRARALFRSPLQCWCRRAGRLLHGLCGHALGLYAAADRRMDSRSCTPTFRLAPGPITAGIVSPFKGRLSARFGMRSTVVAGAVLFAAAGAWPLASAGGGPAYAAVVLPSTGRWGVANALIQPSLFASADRRARSWRRGQRCWPWHARSGRPWAWRSSWPYSVPPGNGPGRVRPCLDRCPDHRGHDRLRRPAPPAWS